MNDILDWLADLSWWQWFILCFWVWVVWSALTDPFNHKKEMREIRDELKGIREELKKTRTGGCSR